ncbi:hypothetical protein ASG01_15005 [Chryseobacterium sp. Leaf180]|uniref:T9SS type A sorting domain-containing protein n=1 Tax=Chryseobacterium sp. Leaf180 TaxID=1736289 RepID=UPI0006F4C184|nr:T9SS type A sorting domain-containing protein [Chryseobacterium sp. Leaf180]KQR90869.1 hypothetical protein ASG01_15005 [Chryseobacterium sp. Leaf180]
MKNSIFYSLVFFAGLYSAQVSQFYERSWGTYFGGVYTNGTTGPTSYKATEVNDGNIIIDRQYNSSSNTTYYNQFITSGMQGFTPGIGNRLEGKISDNGSLLYSKYAVPGATLSTSESERIIYRDEDGSYYVNESKNILNASASTGVWLTGSIVEDIENNRTSLLAKYDANGIFLWRTFIPAGISDLSFTTDTAGNIYFAGRTKKQDLADTGSYQSSFVLDYVNGSLRQNAYLVKLNSLGQKIWSTYYPAEEISSLDEYNGDLYLVTSSDFLGTNTQLATNGTFQQTKALSAISRFSANTGQRIWGTYYGPSDNYGSISQIKVTESGIYTLGLSIEIYSANNTNYFATPGAYQAQPAGNEDIVISKFDFSGQRVWSTYFGGTESDEFSSLDVKGSKILISGGTLSQNIASANAFVNVKPNLSVPDIFFAMFNTSGELVVSSYYGATDVSLGIFLGGSVKSFFSNNSESFYLAGITANHNGFSAEGAFQPAILPIAGPGSSDYTFFIAKFASRNLATSENTKAGQIKLFNNPNNGNFNITGDVLSTTNCKIHIFDISGKLIYKEDLPKGKIHRFSLENLFVSGTYIFNVSSDNGEALKTFKLVVKK